MNDDVNMEIRRLESEIKRLKSLPEDDFEIGSVIRWDCRFGGGSKVYNCSAIKTGRGWFCTGSSTYAKSWRRLLDDLLYEADNIDAIWYVFEWRRVDDVEEWLAKTSPRSATNEEAVPF